MFDQDIANEPKVERNSGGGGGGNGAKSDQKVRTFDFLQMKLSHKLRPEQRCQFVRKVFSAFELAFYLQAMSEEHCNICKKYISARISVLFVILQNLKYAHMYPPRYIRKRT